MARDPSGNYTLPPGINPVQPGTVIDVNWANPTLDDIAVALTDSLSRSGKGGMSGPLVMNGNKITSVGAATVATDVPQAQQVRDSAFTGLITAVSDGSGNNYVGTALLVTPPVNGTNYQFLADRNNTGPSTLAVNGGAQLPILIHGAPTPPGLLLAGAVISVAYYNATYRLVSLASAGSAVNSVQSTDLQLISVNNDITTSTAILTPHSNVPGGMVKLDGSTKVPVAQLPFTDLHYIGIWNAAPGTNPPTTFNNGDFFIITIPGTLTINSAITLNQYGPLPMVLAVGDAIALLKGSTATSHPDGWYFIPAAARPAVASTVSMTETSATPPFGGITNAQTWMVTADAEIRNKLPLAGGTMSGYIVSSLVPSIPNHVPNKAYVDARVAATGGVNSFNGRQGAITLTSPDVTGALGYIPFPTTAAIAGVPTPITGNVSMTENLSVTKGIGALYFAPTYFLRDAISGTVDLDFFQGQSQRWNLAGSVIVDRVLNIPQGSIIRVAFGNLHGFTVTWPGIVIWPNGITPDLASGVLGLAIVVIESFSGSGGAHMAAATIY